MKLSHNYFWSGFSKQKLLNSYKIREMVNIQVVLKKKILNDKTKNSRRKTNHDVRLQTKSK